MEIFYISLCQLPLSLTLCVTMKIHPCQVFTHKDLPEPSHFWAEQSQLSQSLLPCQMLQTCNHLCGILLDPCTRDPRSGPSTPVTSHQRKRERVTSLDVLTVLFPMHSRTPSAFFASGAHCQVMSTWDLPKVPGPFLPGYFAIVWPQPGVVHGQDWTFPFLELQEVLVTHFSSLFLSLWTAPGISATSSIFCHLQSC